MDGLGRGIYLFFTNAIAFPLGIFIKFAFGYIDIPRKFALD
jgi:hypothetical protein